MERVDDVDDDNPAVNFSFRFSKQSGRHVVTLGAYHQKISGY